MYFSYPHPLMFPTFCKFIKHKLFSVLIWLVHRILYRHIVCSVDVCTVCTLHPLQAYILFCRRCCTVCALYPQPTFYSVNVCTVSTLQFLYFLIYIFYSVDVCSKCMLHSLQAFTVCYSADPFASSTDIYSVQWTFLHHAHRILYIDIFCNDDVSTSSRLHPLHLLCSVDVFTVCASYSLHTYVSSAP